MGKILITGNLGYIGTVMTEVFLKEGYDIVGLDTNFYRDKKLISFEFSKEFIQLFKDIREIKLEDLKGIDTIVHLAALSNDPIGELNPELTNEINYLGSLRLAKLAKKSGVSRFLFSSSCSIYGQTKNEKLDENSPMNPLSAYARSKVDLENALLRLSDNSFSPIYLRNGTTYGVSPNMRFDLVVNNLTGWGFSTKIVRILSDGRAWRPIVHIEDISNAFLAVLRAERDIIHNEAFNVGINSENYQVKDIAEEIHKQMKNCEVKILGKDNPDQRNYIVNFDKINKKLKLFKPKWTLERGIRELIETFENINLDYETFQSKNFTRLKQIKFLLQNKLINKDLYWK
ncbi:MAG: NAD-dependent epimerase/dehydratase family protein [Promethearchaeota archaeon]